jgi:hypothetical protein
MTADWEYQIVEESNPAALQERVTALSREGWEPVSLGYAGECRLLSLVRRRSRIANKSRPSADGRGGCEPLLATLS